MLITKILLLLTLLYITFQDIIERQVYWFLLILIGLLVGYLHYNSTLKELFLVNVLMNLGFVYFLFLIIYLYSRLKLKINFNEAIGLGDLILFVGLAFSFATISFLVIFIFALAFSMILHLFLRKIQKQANVPLAGYMSLFFALTYVAQWTGLLTNLYSV